MYAYSSNASFVAVIELDETEKPFVPEFTWVDYLTSKGCTGTYSPTITETSTISCSSGLDENDADYPDEPFPVKKIESLSISNSNMPTLKNLTPLEEIGFLNLKNINATDLSGLENLRKVVDFRIHQNPTLKDMSGLKSITEITKNCWIRQNDIQNLDWMLNITHFVYKWDYPEPLWGFYTSGNNDLYDFSGLRNVQTKNNDFSVDVRHDFKPTITPSAGTPFCVNKVANKFSGDPDTVDALRSCK